MRKGNKILTLLVLGMVFMTAQIVDAGTEGKVGINLIPETPINYSQVNVNNSQFLQTYNPIGLRDLFKTTYDTYYSNIKWNYNQSDGSYNSSYLKKTGDTMSGDLQFSGTANIDMNGRFIRESILWVPLYDGSSLYNNFMPSFSDTLFYGNYRDINITSNRAIYGGTLTNVFNLNNNQNVEWSGVSSANPVVLNITYGDSWGSGKGPYLNDFEVIFSWRQENAINYTINILHDSNDDGTYTWDLSKCSKTNNDDYIIICNVNTWRVRTIIFNVTASGDGDRDGYMRIGTIQAKSSNYGDETGHLASRGSNTFFGSQIINSTLQVKDGLNVGQNSLTQGVLRLYGTSGMPDLYYKGFTGGIATIETSSGSNRILNITNTNGAYNIDLNIDGNITTEAGINLKDDIYIDGLKGITQSININGTCILNFTKGMLVGTTDC